MAKTPRAKKAVAVKAAAEAAGGEPAADPQASATAASIASQGAFVALAASPQTAAAAVVQLEAPDGEGGAEDAELDLTGRVLSVRALLPSRRRAGFAFGREAIPLSVDDLSEDQLGKILADPQLIITVV